MNISKEQPTKNSRIRSFTSSVARSRSNPFTWSSARPHSTTFASSSVRLHSNACASSPARPLTRASIAKGFLLSLCVACLIFASAFSLGGCASSDPYDYKNLKEQNGRYAYYKDGEQVSKTVIDVSDIQGDVNWSAVKNDSVDAAMIRLGRRGYTEGSIYLDSHFYQNIVQAQAENLPCGVYFFSQAITEAEAEEEKGINKESIWTTQKLLSTPQVWIHGVTLGVQLLFASGLMVQLFPRLLEIGFDSGTAGMMMLASGLLALPGSYLCGVLDSKIGARKAAYTSYIFGILAMVLNLTGNTVCVWISLVCIGMVVGGAANWPASLCIEEFGDSFANGYGIIQPMIQVVGAVGPAFFATFYGMTGSYKIPYICGAVLMFVGLIGFATLAKPGFAKKEEEKYKK